MSETPRRSTGPKGIDWSDEPQTDYVERGATVKVIAERYGCSERMVRAKRKELGWDALRAAKDGSSAEVPPTAAEGKAAKEGSRPHSSAPTPATETSSGERTPEQIERQERAFNLSVLDGLSVREIAIELKCSTNTVLEDLAHEQERWATVLDPDMVNAERIRAIAFYRHIGFEALRLAKQADGIETLGDPDGDEPVRLVSKSGLIRGFDAAIKARTRIDALLTLEPITTHKTRKARAEATIAERSEIASSGKALGDGITIKHVILDPEKIPVDERGRAITE
jgi:transposase-like protein